MVAIAWLHSIYNDFRLIRLSPKLSEAIEKSPYILSAVFCGLRNLDDLRSLARIHNRVDWHSINLIHSVSLRVCSMHWGSTQSVVLL
eukprot:IDg7210t1